MFFSASDESEKSSLPSLSNVVTVLYPTTARSSYYIDSILSYRCGQSGINYCSQWLHRDAYKNYVRDDVMEIFINTSPSDDDRN